MARLSSLLVAALALPASLVSAVPVADAQCDSCSTRVVVVNMPTKTAVPVAALAAEVNVNAKKVTVSTTSKSSSTKKAAASPTKVSISHASKSSSTKKGSIAATKVSISHAHSSATHTSKSSSTKKGSIVATKVSISHSSAAQKATAVPTSISLSTGKPSVATMTSVNLSSLGNAIKTSVSLAPTSSVVVQPKESAAPKNITQTFVPIKSSNNVGVMDIESVGSTAPSDASLKSNVSMHYGSADSDDDGKIGMSLNMTSPAVMLETVTGIKSVTCSSSSIAVAFSSAADYSSALSHWSAEKDFVVITNNGGNCDQDSERGFYKASKTAGDSKSSTITLTAAKAELSDIASNMEMTFHSIPAGSLTKRASADPLLSFGFAKALPNDTVLYNDNKYVKVVADEAWFTTNITFSGKMNFNFWHFRMEELYFDVDVDFETEVAMSAEVKARYMQVFKYAPKDLSFTLVTIPGIITVGPGVQFGLGAEIDVDAALNAKAILGFAIPDGKVHLDMVHWNQTNVSGWDKPVYHASANISQGATAVVNPNAELTVQVALKLLGGIVDLSSGFTASPSMYNTFKLVGAQGAGISGTGSKAGADVSLPASCSPGLQNGVALKSDLAFNLTGFVTKYWSGQIASLEVPILDNCWALPKINGTLM